MQKRVTLAGFWRYKSAAGSIGRARMQQQEARSCSNAVLCEGCVNCSVFVASAIHFGLPTARRNHFAVCNERKRFPAMCVLLHSSNAANNEIVVAWVLQDRAS